MLAAMVGEILTQNTSWTNVEMVEGALRGERSFAPAEGVTSDQTIGTPALAGKHGAAHGSQPESTKCNGLPVQAGNIIAINGNQTARKCPLRSLLPATIMAMKLRFNRRIEP
jgi:hypothetical protein